MCGRFTQIQSRDDYLEFLLQDAERDIPYDPEPIGRYNVAPGTKVLLLNHRDDSLHLDPVVWSIDLALITGQRRKDVTRMKFSDINDDRLHITQVKTGAMIAIPLSLTLIMPG